ncbi:MAG: SET domain-containing protein-lysine N-methyltransferase [Jatrophihabitantaceae bacterium]
MAAPDPDCWLHPDVSIGTSAIAGRGLFAHAPLAAGAAVSRLGGRLVSDAELSASSERYVDSIVVDVDVNLVLPPGTPNHFANHSCDPNLGWAGAFTLVALRDIAAGEEVTCDYATSTVDPSFLLRCHCETYRCRQMVAGDDWQIAQLQRRYAGRWVPYVQRLIDHAAQLSGPRSTMEP